jgi:hypothetical protein
MFVGVRGSGETAPYGTTVTGIRDGLASRWAGRGTVRQVWLDYPAADPLTLKSASMSALLLDDPMPSTPYFDSARIGAERLSALLTGQSKRCPKEWVVLAGFSQGAQAITEALARTDTSSRLAGAILAGNPDHHPGQNAQELSGTAPLTSIGLSALLYYLRGRVEQVGGTGTPRSRPSSRPPSTSTTAPTTWSRRAPPSPSTTRSSRPPHIRTPTRSACRGIRCATRPRR